MPGTHEDGDAEAYALGALDPAERTAFEGHLAGCAECQSAVERQSIFFHGALSAEPVAPPANLRQHVLEFTDVPSLPIDVTAYEWDEPVPGIRMHTLVEDASTGLRKVLVWAKPGARYPTHRHLGDEEILVLQGSLGDSRAAYGPGQICRSRTGFVHSETVIGNEDCFCFIVYHGDHESVAE